MPTLTISEPNPKQKLVLEDNTHKYIGFGGARGGGKSWVVRTKAVLLCLNYSGIKVMIVRKTYPELQENHIVPLTQMLRCYNFDPAERLASYNDAKKQITFQNGSKILFRYCDNEKDAERFQGTETDCLFIDEATQQEEIIFDKLKACVRGVNEFPKRVYITCNPGGVGHQWVKRLFVDREYNSSEKPEEYVFYRSLVTDNYALMKTNPDYIHQLEALPNKLRQAWLLGNFDIFEGQFFEEFSINPPMDKCIATGYSPQELKQQHRWCHVIPKFDELPLGWQVYRSFDWGYSRPFSCGYWTQDFDGVVYRIAEYYGFTGEANEGLKWDADRVFRALKEYEDTNPLLAGKQIMGVADPAIWDKSRGVPISEMGLKYGINFTPGDHKRIPGWMQFHYRFAFDDSGFARMYICENCKQFIRTIPLLQYDETNVEDIDTDGEDHIADEARYFLMSRPVAPIKQKVEPIITFDPINQYRR